MRRISWAAVLAVLLSVGAIVLAATMDERPELAGAVAMAGVVMALLSLRDQR